MAAHGSARRPVAESGNAERSGRHSHGGPWERVRESSITSQYLVRTSVLDHRQSDAPIVPYYNPYDLEFVFNLSTFNSATCAGSAHNKATPSLCWRAVRCAGQLERAGPPHSGPIPSTGSGQGPSGEGVFWCSESFSHMLCTQEKRAWDRVRILVYKCLKWSSGTPPARRERSRGGLE